MKLVIIKYNAGNVRSVSFALERVGVKAIVSDDPETVRTADKVIFPGVGEASTAMEYLKKNKLDMVIVNLKQPVLGICLGMQLMCEYSEEGNTNCLGIFPQRVLKFKNVSKDLNYKIPQIGWNKIYDLKTDLFENIRQNEYMYFVHGYYVEIGENTISKSNYLSEYSSGIQKNNFYAVQFHPEKSALAGQQIISNFLKL